MAFKNCQSILKTWDKSIYVVTAISKEKVSSKVNSIMEPVQSQPAPNVPQDNVAS